MNAKMLSASAALGLGALCAVAPVAHAQDEVIVVETARPTLYMNGGIGSDEQAYMRNAAKDFDLRMDFSESKTSEFVADVRLVITDMRGNPVFYLPSAGPMTNVKLPPGTYRVSAGYKGKTETRTVTLAGKQGKDLHFQWRDPSAQ